MNMGKRSDFKRRAQDKYYTPEKAVLPLISSLSMYKTFIEPCAGDGRLVEHIEKNSELKCVYACDIEPDEPEKRKAYIATADAMDLTAGQVEYLGADAIICNTPWTRQILHPMIEHFRNLAPTWLLFDSDWAYTKQAKPYLKYCAEIIAVGRVSWMENGTSGMDNASWYKFVDHETETIFVNN